jgi:hypothetical protein
MGSRPASDASAGNRKVAWVTANGGNGGRSTGRI